LYSDLRSPTLRQGDVCGPIPFPKFKNAPQPVLRPQGWASDADVNSTLELPADSRYVVVVSHCCEFNEAKRAQFLVARIQDFAGNLTSEARIAIRAANDAIRESDAEQRYDYIDTFVLDPLTDCFAEPQLVSFTTITALPISMVGTVKKTKHAELEHEHRVRLRSKLGFFFGRDAEDIDEKDKRTPDADT
jgi:hypothetical protein